MLKEKIAEYKGFYMYVRGRDIFYGTEKRNKTKYLAEEILQTVFNITGENAKQATKELLYMLSPAVCTVNISTIENGAFAGKGLDIEFKGENFTCGYIFTDHDAKLPVIFNNGIQVNFCQEEN